MVLVNSPITNTIYQIPYPIPPQMAQSIGLIFWN